jgi:uncharacterized membrane protein YdjX (TVP38/TMEM64 family)
MKVAGRRPLLRYLPILLIAVAIGTGLALGWHEYFTLQHAIDARQSVRQFAADHVLIAAVAYVLGYAIAVAVAFPATWLLTVMGSAVFGLVGGGLLAASGATLGATALFLAARTAFGDVLRKSAQGFVARVAAGFERNAFSYLLALRLAPLLPFTVVNVLPALFKVSIPVFVGATLFGILPGTFVYASIGAGLDDIIASAAAEGRLPELGDLISPTLTLGLLGLAVLAVLPTVLKSFLSRRSKT